ncbi:hypothetical protein ACLOJK_024967 [Asimina triloba]
MIADRTAMARLMAGIMHGWQSRELPSVKPCCEHRDDIRKTQLWNDMDLMGHKELCGSNYGGRSDGPLAAMDMVVFFHFPMAARKKIDRWLGFVDDDAAVALMIFIRFSAGLKVGHLVRRQLAGGWNSQMLLSDGFDWRMYAMAAKWEFGFGEDDVFVSVVWRCTKFCAYAAVLCSAIQTVDSPG